MFLIGVAGAMGQPFIFYTIKTFGPLVFTIIMATRQLFSMLISFALYGHAIAPSGVVGAALVFGAIGYRIRRKHAEARAKAAAKAAAVVADPQQQVSGGK